MTQGVSDTQSQAPLPLMSLLWSSPASHVSRTLLFCLSDKLRCSGGSGTSGHRKGNISTVPGVAFVCSPPQVRSSPPPSAPSAGSGVHMSRPSGPGPSALFYVCSLLGLTATTCLVSRAALAHVSIPGGLCWPHLWTWALTRSGLASCAGRGRVGPGKCYAQPRKLSWR